jgi:uncharacterized protein (TIGR02284 family)
MSEGAEGIMQEFEPVMPERYDREKIVSTIEKLIDQCRDGEEGYADAAKHIHNSELKQVFVDHSRERARFAAELEAELEKQGRWQTTRQGSVTGMVERTAFDIKRALGGDDAAVLQALEHYEDHARDAYLQALGENLPDDVAGLLRSQAQAVYGAHQQMKLLRERKAA